MDGVDFLLRGAQLDIVKLPHILDGVHKGGKLTVLLLVCFESRHSFFALELTDQLESVGLQVQSDLPAFLLLFLKWSHLDSILHANRIEFLLQIGLLKQDSPSP